MAEFFYQWCIYLTKDAEFASKSTKPLFDFNINSEPQKFLSNFWGSLHP